MSDNVTLNSVSTSSSKSLCHSVFQVCLVGKTLNMNEALMKAIQALQVKVVFSETALDCLGQGREYTTIFVLPEFEGKIFHDLRKSGQRIFGPTAIIQYSEKRKPLPSNVRPLYNISMRNVVVCFTGFRVKEELARMAEIVHHMGGSVRKDLVLTKITHLVANSTSGEKYQFASSYDVPVMTMQWIDALWARRHDPYCKATDDDMMVHKLKPFVGCVIAFIGYHKDEKKHMEEVALENGGTVVSHDDETCTHFVVDNVVNSIPDIPYERRSKVDVVKSEWFWATVQLEARANEHLYWYEPPNSRLLSSSITIPSASKGSRRKRLESVAHLLAMESEETELLMSPEVGLKSNGVAKLSISGSFLDATMSPDKSLYDNTCDGTTLRDSILKSPPPIIRTFGPRQQVCAELYQTESNYVKILYTILSVFKEPLEEPEQVGSQLLSPAEIKLIFGNIPPIYEVHQKLRTDLSEILHSTKEDISIGNLVLKHAHEMLKAYPPFINFFEETKQVLSSCDTTKPRFHAFLKRCQSKPECGRQSLQELLIRPVQRLPSMILLLNDILKHTNKSDPDYAPLEKAITTIKEVLTHINEDKRKTEGQVAMFDIVNDIENCPPNLLSSHRTLVLKMDTQEIGDLISKKNDTITLFLFNDVLEICKKRKSATATLKSPGISSLTSGSHKLQAKSYRHLELTPLSQIKRVVDIIETEDCKNFFSIVVRSNQEMKDKLFTFVLMGDNMCKDSFLRTLCRQIANSVCRTDTENILTSMDPSQLDLQGNDASSRTLSKAFKLATKTRDKLGRALSMRRTPTKRELSRAVSTFISPFKGLGSPATLMRNAMASTTNLANIEATSSTMLAPSPVPEKRKKSSSFGVGMTKYA